jgi:hypothetical protein
MVNYPNAQLIASNSNKVVKGSFMEINDCCPFCNSKCDIRNGLNASVHYTCKECGEYEISFVCLGSSTLKDLTVSQKQQISHHLKQQLKCTSICFGDIGSILAK